MFHWICPECGREIPPAVKECPACDPRSVEAAAEAEPPVLEAKPEIVVAVKTEPPAAVPIKARFEAAPEILQAAPEIAAEGKRELLLVIPVAPLQVQQLETPLTAASETETPAAVPLEVEKVGVSTAAAPEIGGDAKDAAVPLEVKEIEVSLEAAPKIAIEVETETPVAVPEIADELKTERLAKLQPQVEAPLAAAPEIAVEVEFEPPAAVPLEVTQTEVALVTEIAGKVETETLMQVEAAPAADPEVADPEINGEIKAEPLAAVKPIVAAPELADDLKAEPPGTLQPQVEVSLAAVPEVADEVKAEPPAAVKPIEAAPERADDLRAEPPAAAPIEVKRIETHSEAAPEIPLEVKTEAVPLEVPQPAIQAPPQPQPKALEPVPEPSLERTAPAGPVEQASPYVRSLEPASSREAQQRPPLPDPLLRLAQKLRDAQKSLERAAAKTAGPIQPAMTAPQPAAPSPKPPSATQSQPLSPTPYPQSPLLESVSTPIALLAPPERKPQATDPVVASAVPNPNRAPLLRPAPAPAPMPQELAPLPVSLPGAPQAALIAAFSPGIPKLAVASLQDSSALPRRIRMAKPSTQILRTDTGARITLPGPALPPALRSLQDAGLSRILVIRPKAVRKGSPSWLVGSLVAVALLACLVGFALFDAPRTAADPKPDPTPVRHAATDPNPSATAASSGVSTASSYSLTKAIEVTGFRFVGDKKPEVRYLVVNHSGSELEAVTVYVTLRSSATKPGQPPLFRFSFRAPALGPFESKEMAAAVDKPAHPAADWQSLHADIELGQ